MSTSTDPWFDDLDLQEEDYYCEHGTFIGNPHGGDYLCGWCEDGISLEEYLLCIILQENRRARSRAGSQALAEAFSKAPDYRVFSEAPLGYQSLIIMFCTTMGGWVR